jgi:hypothetical protein
MLKQYRHICFVSDRTNGIDGDGPDDDSSDEGDLETAKSSDHDDGVGPSDESSINDVQFLSTLMAKLDVNLNSSALSSMLGNGREAVESIRKAVPEVTEDGGAVNQATPIVNDDDTEFPAFWI